MSMLTYLRGFGGRLAEINYLFENDISLVGVHLVLFLVIVEYFRDHLDREKRISEMTQEELIESIRTRNKEHGAS